MQQHEEVRARAGETDTPPEAAPPPPRSRERKLRWYVVHVYSGFEKQIARQIREEADSQGIASLIPEALVPSHEVTEIYRGARRKRERNFFPGYILVQMAMDDRCLHLIRSLPRVTGFLGSGSKPTPLREHEAVRLRGQMEGKIDRLRTQASFSIGDRVRICEGPFIDFNGQVGDVDQDRSRLKVRVSIFGRQTPVEVDFAQVEKLD